LIASGQRITRRSPSGHVAARRSRIASNFAGPSRWISFATADHDDRYPTSSSRDHRAVMSIAGASIRVHGRWMSR
jgi:hypothetical protein